jgi:hypothetical protein
MCIFLEMQKHGGVPAPSTNDRLQVLFFGAFGQS